MTSLPTDLTTERRNYTTSELPPTLSENRLLDYAAVGKTSDGNVSLIMSEDAAQHLAKMVLRYSTAAHRLDDDHDVAFWDAVAIDLMTAGELTAPPASSGTTMILSLGKTTDR